MLYGVNVYLRMSSKKNWVISILCRNIRLTKVKDRSNDKSSIKLSNKVYCYTNGSQDLNINFLL